MNDLLATQSRRQLEPLRAAPPAPREARARVRKSLAAIIPAIGASSLIEEIDTAAPSQDSPTASPECSVPEVRPSGVAPKSPATSPTAPATLPPAGEMPGSAGLGAGVQAVAKTGALLGSPILPIATFLLGGITGAALFAVYSGLSTPRGRGEAVHSSSDHVAAIAHPVANSPSSAAQVVDSLVPSPLPPNEAPAPNTGAPASAADAEAMAVPTADSTALDAKAQGSSSHIAAAANRARGSVEKTPAAGRVPQLSAERRMLDEAKARLVRGDPAHALQQLQRHRETFPRALLAEERDAMQVEALVHLRRYEQARAAAAAFRARTPGSLFMPAIESAIESIP